MICITGTRRHAAPATANAGTTLRMAASASRVALVAVLAVLAGLALAGPALASAGRTTRESVATDGTQSDAGIQSSSQDASTSSDGSVTAFSSAATKFVPNDTNAVADVFVHDDGTGTTTRVSVATDGTQANGGSFLPSVSGDGRFVAFQSDATNLVADDTNGRRDVFVRDRTAATTTLVSIAPGGGPLTGDSSSASVSADGRYVAFVSNLFSTPGDAFVRDLQTNTTTRVSLTNDGQQATGTPSFSLSAISADGRYVAFLTAAALVSSDTNGFGDIYVRDRTAGTTTLVTVANDGSLANAPAGGSPQRGAISADGRYVAFQSRATNLVPGDTNGLPDIFVRDLITAKTVRVSVATNGDQLGFTSFPSISGDGRLVAFYSANDRNVLVRDRDVSRSGTLDTPGNTATTVESVASDGTPGDNTGIRPSLASDGSRVAFQSDATNLVDGDTNAATDIFTHTLKTGVNVLTVGTTGPGRGTVTSSPAGLACEGASCAREFTTGATVTLTANPAAGSAFTGFKGACTGTDPCTVTLDQARSVTANFTTAFALTVVKDGTGQGTVTSTPAAIDCGSNCSADIAAGTSVTLTATPAAGSTFTGFTGACTGTGPCTVTLDQARSVTATFTTIPRFALTVTRGGTGQGSVTGTPGAINCGTSCNADYETGTRVTLTATAAPGSTFTGFGGGCTGTAPCVVTVDRAKTVTATFLLNPVTAPPKTDPTPTQPPVTQPPVTQPPVVKPPVKIVPPSRVSVAGFTARVTPRRDRRAPYRFTISGGVRRPAGVSASACKGGRVSVQTKVAKKTVSTRRVTLKADCSYRVSVTFMNKRRLGRGRLTLRVRFLGTARLKPKTARTLSARAG